MDEITQEEIQKYKSRRIMQAQSALSEALALIRKEHGCTIQIVTLIRNGQVTQDIEIVSIE